MILGVSTRPKDDEPWSEMRDYRDGSNPHLSWIGEGTRKPLGGAYGGKECLSNNHFDNNVDAIEGSAYIYASNGTYDDIGARVMEELGHLMGLVHSGGSDDTRWEFIKRKPAGQLKNSTRQWGVLGNINGEYTAMSEEVHYVDTTPIGVGVERYAFDITNLLNPKNKTSPGLNFHSVPDNGECGPLNTYD
jgi:hypothetical protein